MTQKQADAILPLKEISKSPAVLELKAITKVFPGVKALSEVSLKLIPGEVTALVGENGAGKSTVVKILTGIYQPDDGIILVDGQPTIFPVPQAASQSGVTAIHQETVLFDELSVAENIFLGHAPRGRFGLIDLKIMNKKSCDILHSIGARIDPEQKLKDLGIANKHLVAIARALSTDARVVIMDEPTASLSHKEIEELYELVESLKSQGKAILFISHKFDEIFRIADNYTVFRDGQIIGDGAISDVTDADLVKMMVGRDVSQIFPKRKISLGKVILQVKSYTHPTEFEDISFTLSKGEILGFYGLVGAGRSEFMQALFGITLNTFGTIKIEDKPVQIKSPADAVENGIVYVPEDRGRQGAILDLPIFQNITLPSLGKISGNGFLKLAKEFKLARDYTERLELRAASFDTHVGNLSGGNQQKVVIAKWLATQPKIIILDEPTKGVDIGSKAAVHEFMVELAEQGLAIIMVSSEIPEVLGMSDRVIVMREGRMVTELNENNLQPETLVRHAAGI